jgi:hypothetical protein
VKIKFVHHLCGREVLVQQVRETGGHCPWDGKPFSRDYTAILAESLEAAENAGGVLENALEKIASMDPDITFDRRTIIEPLTEQLERLEPKRPSGRRR